MSDVVRHELENMVVRKQRKIESAMAEQIGLEKEADKLSAERLVLEGEVAELSAHLQSLNSPFAPTSAPKETDDFVKGEKGFAIFPEETVEFTKEAIGEYIDDAIRAWRLKRDSGIKTPFDAEQSHIASHYVDAYQSVRTSLFGELLP